MGRQVERLAKRLYRRGEPAPIPLVIPQLAHGEVGQVKIAVGHGRPHGFLQEVSGFVDVAIPGIVTAHVQGKETAQTNQLGCDDFFIIRHCAGSQPLPDIRLEGLFSAAAGGLHGAYHGYCAPYDRWYVGSKFGAFSIFT